jgi:hypothetical protein
MSELKFESPPEKVRKSWGRHYLIAHRLKAKPQEWAVVGVYGGAESAGSTARQIRRARLGAYQPAGSFEAEARVVDNEARVYARFVGEKEKSDG